MPLSQAHEALVAALNAAWDDLASRRARTSGRDPDLVRLAGLLNKTHPLTEAAVTIVQEGTQAAARGNRGDRGDRRAIPVPTSARPPPPAGDGPRGRVMTAALAAAVDLVPGRRPGDAGATRGGRRWESG